MESIRQENDSKIGELRAAHEKEIESVRFQLVETRSRHSKHVEQSLQDIQAAKIAAAGQGSQEATTALENQKVEYTKALDALRRQHEEVQRTGRVDSTSRIDTMTSEILSLKFQLEEQKQEFDEKANSNRRELEGLLKEKSDVMAANEKSLKSMQQELEHVRSNHAYEVKELDRTMSGSLHDMQHKHSSAQQKIRELEQGASATSSQHDEHLRKKESDISSMRKVIESLQDELQTLRESKDREVDTTKVKLIQEHQQRLSRTHAEHDLALVAVRDDANEKRMATQSDHEREITMWQKKVENAQTEHEASLNETTRSTAEMRKRIDSLQNERDSAKELNTILSDKLGKNCEELLSLKQVLETFYKDSQGKDEQHVSALKKMKEDLQSIAKALETKTTDGVSLAVAHSEQIERLKRNHAEQMEALESESNEKLQQQAVDLHAKHDALQHELQAAEERLSMSLKTSKDQHVESTKVMKESHAKELESVKTTFEADYAQVKQEVEVKAAEQAAMAEEKHRKVIDELRQELDIVMTQTREEHQRVLSELQGQVLQHRRALADAEDKLQSSQELWNSAERDSRDEHQKEINRLQSQLSDFRSDVETTHKELVQAREDKTRFESLSVKHSAEIEQLRTALAQDKDTIERLNATAEEAGKVLPDTSEAERLKEDLANLKRDHEAALAELQGNMKTENDKREKERKQGAEVRDRLVSQLAELEGIRKDLPAAQEQAQRHQQAAEKAQKEVQETEKKLNQALAATKQHDISQQEASIELGKAIATAKKHEVRQQETAAELEKARALAKEHETKRQEVSLELDKTLASAKELEARHREVSAALEKANVESANAKRRSMSHSSIGSEILQDLDALQIIADKEREKNDKLRKQLAEISATAESHATRVREMEAALKVTTAELTETQTKRSDGQTFAGSPTLKKGRLRTSRWAAESSFTNEDDFVEVSGDPEAEELGSTIEGSVGLPFYSASSSEFRHIHYSF